MKNKTVGIFIMMLLIATTITPVVNSHFTRLNAIKENIGIDKDNISEDEIATVYIKKCNPELGKLYYEPLTEMPVDEAKLLKKKFENIWERDLPPEEKLKKELLLLESINVLPSNFSVKDFNGFIDSIANRDKTLEKSSTSTPDLVLNFCSAFGIFALFSTTSFAWLPLTNFTGSYYWPDSPLEFYGYNVTLFLQHAICGIIAPFYGFGYLGTVGLLGNQNLNAPASFIGFIFGAAWLMFAFQWGTPPDSFFEVIIGLAGIPLFMPF